MRVPLGIFALGAFAALAAIAQDARAEAVLPYTKRTHSYSGWDTTVRGDLRTLGMSGAMVGLGDSLIGSLDNPAALAMTVEGFGIEVAGNSIHDGTVQSYPKSIVASSVGAKWNEYPWGVSVASWSPQAEGDTFLLGGPSGAPVSPEVRTREYRLSVARVLPGHRWSIGVNVALGQNTQQIGTADPGDVRFSAISYAPGAGVGVMVQLPKRFLLGFNYSTPMHYAVDTTAVQTSAITDFFQPVETPYRFGAGVGWIPNRLLRAAAGVYLIGASSNVALLRDDATLVGQALTIQPRVGFSYRLAEYKEFEAELAAGGYVEVSRIQGAAQRLHGTVGLEIKPWVFTFGWGLDESRVYENFLYTAGIDLGKLMRKLKLIPPERRPPRAGLLPDPWQFSEEGLPRPLVTEWHGGDGKDIIDIGKEMPQRLGTELLNAPSTLKNFGSEIYDSLQQLPSTFQDESKTLLEKTGIQPKPQGGTD